MTGRIAVGALCAAYGPAFGKPARGDLAGHQVSNAFNRGARSRRRRRVRNLPPYGFDPNVIVVALRESAERRVDNELDPIGAKVIDDIRVPLVHLQDNFGEDAMPEEKVRGPASRGDQEAE